MHDEAKGLGWVDELRAKSAPYYRPRVQLPRLNFGGRTPKQDRTELIPALDQLVTRHAVFESYRSQHGFLEERKLKPSEYEAEIKRADPEDLTEGVLILAETGKWMEPGNPTTGCSMTDYIAVAVA